VFFFTVVFTVFLSLCVHASNTKGAAKWSYHGEEAAQYWGDLSKDYSPCEKGKKQSPINIAHETGEDLPDLDFTYHPMKVELVNNGYTVQLNIAKGNYLKVADKSYELLQMHFHTPSEHYLDGTPFAMEAHFVHKTDANALGVVGVLMKVGDENEILDDFWDKMQDKGQR